MGVLRRFVPTVILSISIILKFESTHLAYLNSKDSSRKVYEQYLKYKSISTFNTTIYFQKAKEYQAPQLSKWADAGAREVVKLSLEENPNIDTLFWNHTDGLIDCKFDIIFHEAIRDKTDWHIRFNFNIASTCLAGSESAIQVDNEVFTHYFLGGASIEGFSLGSEFCQCTIKDHTDGTYHASCDNGPVIGAKVSEIEIIDLPLSAICYNVSLVLDYEHYDAFSEKGSFFDHQYPLLRYELMNRLVCANEAAAITVLDEVHRVASYSTTADESLSKGITTISGVWRYVDTNTSDPNHWNIYMEDEFFRFLRDEVRPHNFAPQYKWEWKYATSTHDTNDKPHHYYTETSQIFRDCLGKLSTVAFIGSSHMRFSFDIIIMDLSSENDVLLERLGPKHGSLSVGNLVYQEHFFASNVALQLHDWCTVALEKRETIAVLFQTGTWDLNYYSLSQLVESNEAAPSIIHTIESFKTRGCLQYIRLVYVSTPPYPHCTDQRCQLSRSGRNNYAAQAFNHYMERELTKLSYPGLQIVQSFDMTARGMFFGETTCVNHYLCNHYTGTPAGFVVADAMKKAVCYAVHWEQQTTDRDI